MSMATALSINALRPFVNDISESYQLDLFVKGVRCGHCVYKIEKALKEKPEVVDFQMDDQNLTLYSHKISHFPELIELINELGFEAIPTHKSDEIELEQAQFKKSLKQLAVAGVCAGNIMLFSTAIYLGAPEPFQVFFNYLSFALCLPVVFYSGLPIWNGFFSFFKSFKFNLDLPIGLAVAFGFGLSLVSLLMGAESIYFDTISVVIFIILSSRFLLEAFVKDIYQKNLTQCIPGVFQARKIQDDQEEFVSPQELTLGDTVKVIKGEVCPVDGELVSQEALMDLSVLTGESEPQLLSKGDKIYAGSTLCNSNALIKVRKTAEKTRVGSLVETSLKSMKHTQEEAFHYVSYFTLLVVSLSVLSFGYFMFWADAATAFQRSFAIIIVACPCALSFGIPLIRLLSGQLSLKSGILVKNPQTLSRIREIEHIFFDKTGTLTEDKVNVDKDSFNQFSQSDQNLILSLELNIEHPISNGFKTLITEDHHIFEVKGFEYIPGRGIKGFIQGVLLEVYSSDDNEGSDGKFLTVFKNKEKLGQLKIDSAVKDTVEKTVNYLSLKNKKISILSGDKTEHVQKLWDYIPLKSRHKMISEATPELKESVISQVSDKTMMVGDGINDIAALQKARVGVTLPGALESNLNVADISLLKNDLGLIELIFKIAQKTRKTEIRLMAFTTIYNSFCIVLALMGFISPVAAAILMPISSLTVLTIVTLSLRRA